MNAEIPTLKFFTWFALLACCLLIGCGSSGGKKYDFQISVDDLNADNTVAMRYAVDITAARDLGEAESIATEAQYNQFVRIGSATRNKYIERGLHRVEFDANSSTTTHQFTRRDPLWAKWPKDGVVVVVLVPPASQVDFSNQRLVHVFPRNTKDLRNGQLIRLVAHREYGLSHR